MKKINLILLAGILFTILACNKVDNEVSEQSNTENISLRDDTSPNPILYADYQWISYIIAGMLYEDVDDKYRSQFIEISETTGVVRLNTLLENPEFYSDFASLAYFYFAEESNAQTGGDDVRALTPTNKPPRPPRGIAGDINENAYVDLFLNEISNYDCSEIYLPKVLNFDDRDWTITSTAHPLDTDSTSDGYKWMELVSGKGEEKVEVSNVLVNDEYVEDNYNIIVTRPTPTTGPTIPSFAEDCRFRNNHSEVDFSQFLNQD